MSRKSNRVARFSGLAIAGLGLAHFTSPRMWVLGLSFSSRQTRSLATVGLIGHLAYLGGNAIRHAQTP
jgi:hypothetical protein